MASIKYILFLICLSDFSSLTLGCNSTIVFKQKLLPTAKWVL